MDTKVQLRDYLNQNYSKKYGFNDSDITMDADKYVNVKGQKLMQISPSNITNGRSYESNNLIDSAMNNLASSQNWGVKEGDVRAGDYLRSKMSEYGIQNNELSWKVDPTKNQNELFIAGKSVGSGYFDPNENKTYMNENSLKSSLEGIAKERNFTTTKTPLGQGDGSNNVVSPDKINELYNKLVVNSEKKFEYDPNTDPAYQSTKKLYEEQGAKAFKDQLARMSATTMGNPSTWATSASAQAQNEYNQKAISMIPQFRDQRYGEFRDQQNNDLNILNVTSQLNQDAVSRDQWLREQQGITFRDKYNQYRDTVDDTRYNEETAYGKSRDALSDTRYNDTTTYNRGRDTLGDTRYNNETTYNRGRDTLADTRYTEETAYGKSRDKVADTRYDNEFSYKKTRDTVDDTRYNNEFAYNKSRDQRDDFVTDRNYNLNVSDSKFERAYKEKQLQQKEADKPMTKEELQYNFSGTVAGIQSLPTKDAIRELNSGKAEYMGRFGVEGYKDLWDMSLAGAIKRGEAKGYDATFGDKKEKEATPTEKAIKEALMKIGAGN